MPGDAPTNPAHAPVAVIGLGCVMPDAADPAAFWQNMVQGRLSIRDVPPERWNAADYFSTDRNQPDKTYSKLGAFVGDFEFDWRKYRIPPVVARQMDANQKWAIEAADQALRDAGYDRKPFDRTRTGVILGNAGGGEIRIGNTMRIYYPSFRDALLETRLVQALDGPQRDELLSDVERRFKAPLQSVTEDTMPGELANVIAGRISNVFDLVGPNYTVDAACASNAAALEIAVQRLRSGDLDMVLTGAVDASQNVAQFVKFAKIGALSPDGCFPFDERANGFVMGEGCALFLLKRESEAIRDGDRVYATIRGVGSSSDGRGRSLVAPTIEGQTRAIERAWKDAGLDPAHVDYVECHGTGTRLGDRVELEALQRTYGALRNGGGPLLLGTVKANIGHLKSAAGAAGLLKTVLALHHGQIPPTIGHRQPIPELAAADARFAVPTRATRWPSKAGPRRAAVSSFGFGGANFHVIVQRDASDDAERAS
jgi:acyl transferase domain-containing protein